MKKATQKKRGLFDQKIIWIVDKRLDNVKAEDCFPEKLAAANKALRGMKLPK